MNKKYGHEQKHKCSTLRYSTVRRGKTEQWCLCGQLLRVSIGRTRSQTHKHISTHTQFCLGLSADSSDSHNFYFLRLCSCRSSCHLLPPCLTASPQPPFSKLDTATGFLGVATTSESQHLTSIPLSVVGCLTLGLLCLISGVRLYHQLSSGSSALVPFKTRHPVLMLITTPHRDLIWWQLQKQVMWQHQTKVKWMLMCWINSKGDLTKTFLNSQWTQNIFF